MTIGLIYHDVVPHAERETAGFPGPLAARYKHTPEQFEAHLDALAGARAAVGLIVPGAEPPGVALTFDDGGASALAVAQRLERRGWRGHFFITTGRTGTPGFLAPGDVRELVARGHAVGSHSLSHPTYMGRLSAAELASEWAESRERLGDLLGVAPTLAAVPGGFLSRAVIDTAADAGYRVLLTSQPTLRMVRRGGLEVRGRYTIWASTPPATAAAFARADPVARARLWCEWSAKGLAKRVSPDVYQRLRRLRAH